MLMSEVCFEPWLLTAILQPNAMSNFNTHRYEAPLGGSGPCRLILQNIESSYGLGGWKGLWMLIVNYETLDFLCPESEEQPTKAMCLQYIYTYKNTHTHTHINNTAVETNFNSASVPWIKYTKMNLSYIVSKAPLNRTVLRHNWPC